MEFRNLTPFSVVEYAMDDKHSERHRVVVMKTGFHLLRDADGHWNVQLRENPPVPLCAEDEFSGEINRSPVLRESDFAPLKPACDIIVNGTAYAPGGVATSEMTVGVLMRSASGKVLLNKTLRITGKRFYQRQSLTGFWYETMPEPFTSLPLDYRYAFGGECRVDADDEYARRVSKANHLTEEQRHEHPDQNNLPLAHQTCPINPLGLGYAQSWYVDACNIHQVEAPRIIATDSPLTLEHFIRCLNGNANWFAPEYQPAGFGCIGRSWLPRLLLAGTYDKTWLETQHPGLPEDFDFGYWNSAPHDQQILFPEPGAEFVLTGFHPEDDIHFTLPAHQGRILLRTPTGQRVPMPMWLDTLEIDTDSMSIAMTWRFLLPGNVPVRVMEARYRTRKA